MTRPGRRGSGRPAALRLQTALLALLLSWALPLAAPGVDAGPPSEAVVLLHGIAGFPLQMAYLEHTLQKAGYRVVNLGYPSTELPIEEAAALVRRRLEGLSGEPRVHLVAHSMGNVVLRVALKGGLPNLGRMVMIAPPNRGSMAAEALRELDLYRWVFGPAGQQLSLDNRAFFDGLPPPPCPFGIVAGGRGDGEGLNPMLPGDDDGTVRVVETELAGAADRILIDSTHTLILFAPETSRQVIAFLREGRFERALGDPGGLPLRGNTDNKEGP